MSDGENKTDVGQLSDTKLWLPDGENKTDVHVGQLNDTKLWLPDRENKTGVGQLSNTKLCLPDDTDVAWTAERHREAMLTRRRE